VTKKPTTLSRDERAGRILDATEELLWEMAPEAISTRHIAERAGVKKALVFYYWGSRAAVFEAVVERYYTRQREGLAQAFEGGGSFVERVHRMLDAHLDFIGANRIYPRLVQQQATGGGEMLEMVRSHMATLFDWTTRVIAEVAPERGPLAARQFYITLTGVIIGYFTYAPLLAERWDTDPLGPEALEERRQHVHWVVDAMLARFDEENAG
jgi:AcrR family transcriptional regulator